MDTCTDTRLGWGFVFWDWAYEYDSEGRMVKETYLYGGSDTQESCMGSMVFFVSAGHTHMETTTYITQRSDLGHEEKYNMECYIQ